MREDTFDAGRWRDRLYHDTERKHGFDGQTGAAFTAWQDAFREDLRRVLGHHLIRENAPSATDPRQTDKEMHPGYVRQEWTIQTERGVRVPFYLFLPTAVEPPYPVVLTLHGHNETGKELPAGECQDDAQRKEVREERRDMAVQAVQRGYAALAPDMRGFGALADAADRLAGDRACTALQKQAQLYGRSLAGERVWDTLRLLDFVEEQSVFDTDQIAVTGHSGGAAVALFAAALDERVSVVAPNAYFCTFRDSIVAIDHCECNYVPGILRLGELWDVAGVIAPRPLGITTGATDTIFPVEGTRRAFEKLQTIYAAIGAEDRCDLHVGEGGHRYYPDGVWPFVASHLSSDADSATE
ncbi:alpha/beta hydrolase family protein [Haloarchaeobius sp. TZWSO28]|uniref:alpha/beta hydrolase family protein n=1 Tax=Haloarchaeobius sp. TZWSO28 TaxID=3446119 RepID=UPI003EBC8A57